MKLDFSYVFRNLDFIAEGAWVTLRISLVSFVFAFIIACIVGTIRAGRIGGILSRLLGFYVEVFRGTPLLVQLFLIYYGLPQLGIVLEAWVAGIVGLALNSGAYMSEIVRASILSVDSGQSEAARVLGYTPLRALRHVVFPQAFRVALPPMMNSLSALLKESSLVSIISIVELTRVGNIIYSRTMAPFEIYLMIALVYLIMTYTSSLIAGRIERWNDRWAVA